MAGREASLFYAVHTTNPPLEGPSLGLPISPLLVVTSCSPESSGDTCPCRLEDAGNLLGQPPVSLNVPREQLPLSTIENLNQLLAQPLIGPRVGRVAEVDQVVVLVGVLDHVSDVGVNGVDEAEGDDFRALGLDETGPLGEADAAVRNASLLPAGGEAPPSAQQRPDSLARSGPTSPPSAREVVPASIPDTSDT